MQNLTVLLLRSFQTLKKINHYNRAGCYNKHILFVCFVYIVDYLRFSFAILHLNYSMLSTSRKIFTNCNRAGCYNII